MSESPDGRPRVLQLIRHRRTLGPANIECLKDYVADAESGKVAAYAICAIGPTTITHRSWSGGMTRQERISLLGQLRLLEAELAREEIELG